MTSPARQFLEHLFQAKLDEEHIVVSKQFIGQNGNPGFLNCFTDAEEFRNWERASHRASAAWYAIVSTTNGAINEKGRSKRGRADLVRAHVLMLDDIGTKAEQPPVEPAYKLETSPDNFQWVYLIEPTDDFARYEGLLDWAHEQGWGDRGAGGAYRLFRIPGSANLKPGRNEFQTVETVCDPTIRSLNDLGNALGIGAETWAKKTEEAARRLGGNRKLTKQTRAPTSSTNRCPDPLLDWLTENDHLINDNYDQKFLAVSCPWGNEHTTGDDTAGYSPLGHGAVSDFRVFKCLHEHCKDRDFKTFSDWAVGKGAPVVDRCDPLTVVQHQYAYIADGRRVVDLEQQSRGGKWVFTIDEWSGKHHQYVDTPHRDKKVLIRTAFLESRNTTKVDTIDYLPGKPQIVEKHGQPVLNSWTLPPHKDTDAEPEIFLDHINYLFPDERERNTFLDWLAFKVQNPAMRSYGVVLVAEDAYGIGRSWLADAIKFALNGQVKHATLAQLIGKGTQAQANYNDTFFECQFLIVEEARDGLSGQDFYDSYETLKERVDTKPTTTMRNTKYGAARDDLMWFNLLVFTNHADALLLPEGDRRFAAFTNPDTKRDESHYERLYNALDGDELARIYSWLMRREISEFSHTRPPMTAAKTQMISMSRGPADEFIDLLKDRHEGDLVTPGILDKKLRKWAKELGLSEHDKYGAIRKRVWRKLGSLRPDEVKGARYYVEGKQQEVRAITRKNHWREIDATRYRDTIMAELEKADIEFGASSIPKTKASNLNLPKTSAAETTR